MTPPISQGLASTRATPAAASADRVNGVTRYDALTLAVAVVVIGYQCFSKQFAYIGLESANIFVGEIFLGVCLLRPRVILFPWLSGLMSWSALSPLAFTMFILVGYGIWECVRGILSGHSVVLALEELAFDYYPIYLFIGLYVGRRHPALLPKIVRIMAVVNGIYGVTYVLFIQKVADFDALSINDEHPGVWAFGQPGASVFSIIGLLCFEKRIWVVVPLVLLNGFTMLGLQVRSEWLALAAALLVWGLLHRKFGHVIAVWVAIFAVLWAIDTSGVRIPGRVSDVSFRETVTRIIAPANLDAAAQLSRDAKDHEGSVLFRTIWWKAIWSDSNSDPRLFLIGYGYGFPLRSLVADWDPTKDVRTPHNAFFFALGYTGWLGVLAFFAWQAAIGWAAWTRYLWDGESFLFLYWLAALIIGLLGNNFEAPFGAIPTYLICGLGIAPALYSRARGRSVAHQAAIGRRALPAAGGTALLPHDGLTRPWPRT